MSTEHDRPAGCLDAETMAAWVDRALPAADAAAAEAHVADCARCRATLAVLVRAMPVVPLPAPWWRRRWVVGTLVPLAAGSLVLAVWVATPREPTSSRVAMPSTPAPAPPPPTLAEASRDAIAPRPLAEPGKAPPGSARAPAEQRVTAEAVAKQERERSEVAGQLRTDEQAAASAQAAAPAAAAEARAARAPAALGATLDRAIAAVDVLSPDPAIRWRLGAAGSISYSADRGVSWGAQVSGVDRDLAAGASPQPSVCWVVGRAGTVLLTTDGRTWRRLEFTESVDLTAIEARDALAATVTAADGRRFQTADGGRTWTRLQEF